MYKKIVLLLLILIFLTGCNKKKFELDESYYGKNDYIEITYNDLEDKKKDSYLLFVYSNVCSMQIPCDQIFKEFMENNNIAMNSMSFLEFKKSSYYKKVKYAPTVIIIKKGKIVAYLDAESEDDYVIYQDALEFKKWVSKYVDLKETE